MVKKETEKVKNVKTLKEELEQKGKEILQLQKSVAEMREQIQEKKKSKDTNEGAGGLLSAGLGMLDASDTVKGEKPNGLLGLVNELGKLAEKAQTGQTTQRTTRFGKSGVVDFRISSRPIRGAPATQPASTLKIIKPSKQSSKGNIILPPSTGTIEEREPIVDVFEEEDYLRVMAQLPIVKVNEIELKVGNSNLTINAGPSTKIYCKTVELPAPVEKKIVQSSYRNGILEVKLKKKMKTNTRAK
jgi:HSP20 family protein